MSVSGFWKCFINSSRLPFLYHSRKDFREEYWCKQIHKPLMTAVGLITTIHPRNVSPTFSNLWWLTFLKIVRRKAVVLCDIKVHQHQALRVDSSCKCVNFNSSEAVLSSKRVLFPSCAFSQLFKKPLSCHLKCNFTNGLPGHIES